MDNLQLRLAVHGPFRAVWPKQPFSERKTQHAMLSSLFQLERKKHKYQKREFIYLNLRKHEIHLISDTALRIAEPGNLLFLFEGLGRGGSNFFPVYNQMFKALAKRSRVRLFKMCQNHSNKNGSQWKVSKKENPNHLLILGSICHCTRSEGT